MYFLSCVEIKTTTKNTTTVVEASRNQVIILGQEMKLIKSAVSNKMQGKNNSVPSKKNILKSAVDLIANTSKGD